MRICRFSNVDCTAFVMLGALVLGCFPLHDQSFHKVNDHYCLRNLKFTAEQGLQVMSIMEISPTLYNFAGMLGKRSISW